VHLARDPHRDESVALKLPRPEVAFSESLRRWFTREGEVAARLDHPDIIPVLEVGAVGPIHYITYPYCSGPTLAAWMGRYPRPMPEDEATRLVSGVARAVGYAHQRGVVHGDLKPGNLLFDHDPDGGRHPLKVTDLGMAFLSDGRAFVNPGRPGVVMGTPAYMSPEQAEGRTDRIGPPSDVYSIGAILYETVTGHPPFPGTTLRAICDRRRVGPFLPLSMWCPGTSQALEDVCRKCLALDPARRFQDGRELAAALGRTAHSFT
jgi:serine/threonine-protein kinase